MPVWIIVTIAIPGVAPTVIGIIQLLPDAVKAEVLFDAAPATTTFS
jgi:hypothetical protein